MEGQNVSGIPHLPGKGPVAAGSLTLHLDHEVRSRATLAACASQGQSGPTVEPTSAAQVHERRERPGRAGLSEVGSLSHAEEWGGVGGGKGAAVTPQESPLPAMRDPGCCAPCPLCYCSSNTAVPALSAKSPNWYNRAFKLTRCREAPQPPHPNPRPAACPQVKVHVSPRGSDANDPTAASDMTSGLQVAFRERLGPSHHRIPGEELTPKEIFLPLGTKVCSSRLKSRWHLPEASSTEAASWLSQMLWAFLGKTLGNLSLEWKQFPEGPRVRQPSEAVSAEAKAWRVPGASEALLGLDEGQENAVLGSPSVVVGLGQLSQIYGSRTGGHFGERAPWSGHRLPPCHCPGGEPDRLSPPPTPAGRMHVFSRHFSRFSEQAVLRESAPRPGPRGKSIRELLLHLHPWKWRVLCAKGPCPLCPLP